MNQIRTFIAIEIPSPIREQIAAFQLELKKSRALVSWVKPNNIHITLKFLGNVHEDKINDIAQTLTAAAKSYRPFTVEISGAGVFPNFKKPRVIWIGARSENNELQQLAAEIDSRLANLGFNKEDRAFKAHLTLGRVKRLQGINELIIKIEPPQALHFGTFEVKEMIVMRSDLQPSGSIYTPLNAITIK